MTNNNMHKIEKVLSKLNVSIRDCNNEYRPLGDILDELSSNWNKISKKDKKRIYKLFGFNKMNKIKYRISAIKNKIFKRKLK